MTKLIDIRREYDFSCLTRKQLNKNPFEQMQLWLKQAQKAELKDATAMTLATATNNGLPDARIVLLKNIDTKGLSWFTSYSSHKGQQLLENPQACLLFYWRDFDRQIKVQGQVEKLSIQEAKKYFHSRPLNSQFSAAASNQSQAIESREALEKKLQRLKEINPNIVVKPEDWGGYRLIPSAFEFWQGRENRLHDRFTYTLNESTNNLTDNLTEWLITRLQP